MISFAKKFLSIALAAVLLLGVFPAAALAAEGNFIHYWTDASMNEKYMGGNWDQELSKDTPRIKDNFDEATGEYTVQDWNLPALDDTADSKFVGWFYCGHPADQCVAGEKIKSANLFPKFEKTAAPTEKPTEAPTEEPTEAPTEKPTQPAAEVKYLRYYNEDGSEITGFAQALSKDNARIAPNLDDQGNYILQSWNLPMNMTDPTGANRKFLGWAFKGHPKDMASVGQSVISANLIAVYEQPAKPVYHTITLKNADKSVVGTMTVVDGGSLNMADLGKMAPKAPEGKEFDGWRIEANNEVVKSNTVFNSDATLIATYRDIEGYNPRPNGPQYLFNVTFDENYNHGGKFTYEVKDGQRMGTLFKGGKLPIPSRNLCVFKGWYLCDANGNMTNNKVDEETLYSWGRDVTLKAKWESEARVKLMIFRNGNTDTPYDVVQLYGYAVGDVIKTSDINIKDFYKNGGKPFKWEGWFDRGGWTLYKAKDNPKPISSIQAVDLDGTTTLFCMVHDDNAPSSNKNPDRTNPKTGDESMIFATTAVMLVSAGALAVYFMDRKRRNG